MIEQGKVEKIIKNFAVVRIERKSACGNCNMCAMSPDKPHIDLEILNSIEAKIGDIVEIEMESGGIVKMSAAAYLIPLLFGGAALTITNFLKAPEWVMLIAFLCGLTVGYIPVKLISNYWTKKKRYTPFLIGIVKNENEKTKENI
ncbi:MAG: SoxR reducing system RseC family protein [Clostridia bacterium]